MSLVPTQRRSPSPLRQADSPAAVRDRRTELGRADEARAEQRERDDARNVVAFALFRAQRPQCQQMALPATPTERERAGVRPSTEHQRTGASPCSGRQSDRPLNSPRFPRRHESDARPSQDQALDDRVEP
jgi:hypothetical protein